MAARERGGIAILCFRSSHETRPLSPAAFSSACQENLPDYPPNVFAFAKRCFLPRGPRTFVAAGSAVIFTPSRHTKLSLLVTSYYKKQLTCASV
jgi:hypothetical protein